MADLSFRLKSVRPWVSGQARSWRFSLDEEGIHLRTQRQMIARSQAIMRKYASAGRCISDELIAERRLEAKREEEEFG